MQNAETIQAAFSQAVEDLGAWTDALVNGIVAQLAEECSANLTQLRGITAMYRMSARPPPSRYPDPNSYTWYPLLVTALSGNLTEHLHT